MAELDAERRSGLHHRRYGRTYLAMRREAERRLREQFSARGGAPQRHAPHYFVLGESRWFAGLYRESNSIRLPLTALSPETTSVTYGDAFDATGVSAAYGFASPDPAGLLGDCAVYGLSDLETLIATRGLPDCEADADYEGYERRPAVRFIEIQVWSDVPVRAWLAGP